MMCEHCVKRVNDAISKLDGVGRVQVNLKQGAALVDFDDTKVSSNSIIEAIVAEGYKAKLFHKDQLIHRSFKIEGMKCEHCVKKVDSAIKELDGIKSVKVDLATGRMDVDASLSVKSDDIVKIIDELGYVANLIGNESNDHLMIDKDSKKDDKIVKKVESSSKSNIKKEKYDIVGMSCAACQQAVTRAVSKLDGVKAVNVNLLANTMVCEYDPRCLGADKIMSAVDKAGYQANIKGDKGEVSKEARLSKSNRFPSEKIRLWVSIPILIILMYIGMGKMIGLPEPYFFLGNKNALTYAFTQLLLTIPIFYINRKFFSSGFKSLFHGSPNMDSLVAIGASASLIYGIVSIYVIGIGLGNSNMEMVEKYVSNLYFETGAMILTLVTLGKYLEARSKRKTNSTLTKLMNLTPKKARVIRNGQETEISVESILLGDIVAIRPGEAVPVDGVILDGESSLDESAITGESIPVDKKVGDQVISASINKNGYFTFKAQKVGKDTTIAKIIELIENANSSKAPIARLADKVAGVFVPIVISLAVLTAIIWLSLGYSLEFSLNNAIGVLVISCPCALGLATPVAITVSTGKAASMGILMKSAEAIEELKKVDTIVLDKTGTITEGKPSVQKVITNDIEEKELLKIASSLEKRSEHPLAKAVVDMYKSDDYYSVKNYLTLPGFGVRGTIGDNTFYIGKLQLMKDNSIDLGTIEKSVEQYLRLGQTPLYVAKEKKIIGVILVADTIKPDSKQAIKDLKDYGLEVIMLTGDNPQTAKAIAESVNIDQYISNVLPSQKEENIIRLQKMGKKVAMVGDGINDSPALTRADVGIAIGSGTDIAIEAADVVLIKSKLSSLMSAINISRNTVINIKENLFWALFYNVIGIPIAAGVLYPAFHFGLSPMIGAACMSISSIFVTLNALRLKYKKIK